jgi:hypothetical protein
MQAAGRMNCSVFLLLSPAALADIVVGWLVVAKLVGQLVG